MLKKFALFLLILLFGAVFLACAAGSILFYREMIGGLCAAAGCCDFVAGFVILCELENEL